MARIFISYRRSDTPVHASRLFEWLSDRYGPEQVFRDVDVLRPGLDFSEAIDRAVGESDVLLAVIGREWLVDDQGHRRLDDAQDYVRREIETALGRRTSVVPVLVEGARMPAEEELPPSLARLSRLQAAELSDDARWKFDKEVLLERLDDMLEFKPREPAPLTPPRLADPSKPFVKWGWIMTAASIIPFLFPLAIVGIVCGAFVITRSKGQRTAMGVVIIVTALVVGFFSMAAMRSLATPSA
jgi:hypothetical protein